MNFILTPIGGDGGKFDNLFDTPSGRAAGVVGVAAATPLSQGGQPHHVLAQGMGAAQIGLVQAIDVSKSSRVADLINQHNALLVNSPTGRPSDVQPVQGIIDGLANIKQGIAEISGVRQR